MSANTLHIPPYQESALPSELTPMVDKQLLIARIGMATVGSTVDVVAPEHTPAKAVDGEDILASIRHNVVARPEYMPQKMIPFTDDTLTKQVIDELQPAPAATIEEPVRVLLQHVIGHDAMYGTRIAEQPELLRETANTYLAEVEQFRGDGFRTPESRPLRYSKSYLDSVYAYFADDPEAPNDIVRDYLHNKAEDPLKAILAYKERYIRYRKQYPPTLVDETPFKRLCRRAGTVEQNLADYVARETPHSLPSDDPVAALALLRKDMYLTIDFPRFVNQKLHSFIEQLASDPRFEMLQAELGEETYNKLAASALSLFGSYRLKTGENIHIQPQLTKEVTALLFEQAKAFTEAGIGNAHIAIRMYGPGEEPPERAKKILGPAVMPPNQTLDTLLDGARAKLPQAASDPEVDVAHQAKMLMEAIRTMHNSNKNFLKGITNSKKYRPWYDAIREDMKQWDIPDGRGQKHLEAAQKRFAQFTAKHLAETDDTSALQRHTLQQLFAHFWKDISTLVEAGVTHMPHRLASYVAAEDIATRIKPHPRRQTAALMVAAWPAQALKRLDEYDAAYARLTKAYSDHPWVGPEGIDYCASLKDADAGIEILLKRAEIIHLMFTDDPDFNDATVELLADNTWGCRDDATAIYKKVMEWKERYHALRDEVVTQGIEADPQTIKYAATDASQPIKRLVGYVIHLEKKLRRNKASLSFKSRNRDEQQDEIDLLPPASSAEDTYLQKAEPPADESPNDKTSLIETMLDGLAAPERQLVAVAYSLPEAQHIDGDSLCAELGILPGDLQEYASQAITSLRQKTAALGSLGVLAA